MAESNPFDLSGRVAVVTGAGRGIGRAIASTLAQAGAAIGIAEYVEESGRRAADELAADGVDCAYLPVDVRDPDSVRAMTAAALERFGHIDVLVNNAGVATNTPSEDVSDAEWMQVMHVNLNGTFWCCREVGRHMLERGSGSIVNMASMSGVISNAPQPQCHYNASKAGVILLTKSLAGEWAKRGVRVNAVSPGYIGTEMTKLGMDNADWYPTWLAMTPMGRVGEPHEIAQAVWFLASDAASFATGTNLLIDGGYTSW
ncbi:MAG: glucose 1-dehydrogenase [Deinococcales bacterium]|jgi:NAD(P)-dependent dehydrogenase (short-subunit alcohol dehydrogenase family)